MKPVHLFYPSMLFAVGAWSMFYDGWMWFGVVMWIVGAVATGWIAIGGVWSERANYYDSLADVLRQAQGVDLDKMAALGLSTTEVMDRIQVDMYQGTRSQHFSFPLSAVKLKPLAEGLLNGQPFSERRWAQLLTATEFRSLRSTMLNKGLIQPVSDKDHRQGFMLTDHGRELLKAVISSPPPPMEMS